MKRAVWAIMEAVENRLNHSGSKTNSCSASFFLLNSCSYMILEILFGILMNISLKSCQESLLFRWNYWGPLLSTHNFDFHPLMPPPYFDEIICLPETLDYVILEGRGCPLPISWHVVVP